MSTIAIVKTETTDLSTTETAELERLEGIVTRGVQTFIEVGKALAEINTRRLYRGTHRTFDAYVRERWGWGRARAYQLIEAAAVAENVNTCRQEAADAGGDLPPIETEAQARQLARIVPRCQAEAWEKAVTHAKKQGKPVTATVVRKVVNERFKSNLKKKTKTEPKAFDLGAAVSSCKTQIRAAHGDCPQAERAELLSRLRSFLDGLEGRKTATEERSA